MDLLQIWHRHSLAQSMNGGKIWSWLSKVFVPKYSYGEPPPPPPLKSQNQILPPIIDWVKECVCQIWGESIKGRVFIQIGILLYLLYF